MTFLSCMKRERLAYILNSLCIGLGGIFVTPSIAYAIPSPELVIGSISSLSQIGALVAATVGGSVLAFARRLGLTSENSGKTILRILCCLIIVTLGLAALNLWQFQSYSAERMARLQSTLTRPAQGVGNKINDANLKETSFGAQETHPLGISTEDAATLLKNDSNVEFWDIREVGENATGTLPMSQHKRFPDVTADGMELTGKKVILFCHNGNRSSETCARLAALGIDCKFISGGIEKWILEGRPFTDDTVRGLSDLRALPDYPNRGVLLDTEETRSLITDKSVGILDARYPGDFETGHLPNAVNVPIRALPTTVLQDIIAGLDDKPYIAACYDRRSCFMSQVLGLELTKAGGEFLGRYTLPWEYFEPKAPKPHIVAWLAERNKSTWSRIIDFVSSQIATLMTAVGVIGAIALVAGASRLMVLPVSLKAERDQIATRTHADELTQIRQETKSNPARQARAVKAFYKKHNITPMRNLLALAFLPLMMLGLTSINQAAGQVGTSFLWASNSGLPDPTFIFPGLFAVLGCVYLHIALAKTVRGRWLCWLIGGPLLFAMSIYLSAAGSAYLVISLALLLVQRVWIEGKISSVWIAIRKAIKGWRTDRILKGMIPLNRDYALIGSGNKAYRLAVLVKHGVQVPRGLVLNTKFLDHFKSTNDATRSERLDAIWAYLTLGKGNGETKLAVRSSGSGEDGADKSYAGVFDSYLDVTRETLGQAICDVDQSFHAVRSQGYHGTSDGMAANVLIQRMVQPEFAGVLFTRDPQYPTLSMLEFVQGTADDLVSGRRNPTTVRFGRRSDTFMDDISQNVDFGPLLDIGRKVEKIFGTPQDVEWTYKDGEFYIVQTRDITASTSTEIQDHIVDDEWCRLIEAHGNSSVNEIILQQDDMSEVLPRPTPLSFSLMQRLWAAGGSVDLACRDLGLRYNVPEDGKSHLTTVFGRLYSDTQRKVDSAVVMTGRSVKSLRKRGGAVADIFHASFLPDYKMRIARFEALNYVQLGEEDLKVCLKELYDWFVYEVHTEVEKVNIAASFFVSEARKAGKLAGVDVTSQLSVIAPDSPASLLAQASSKAKTKQAAFLTANLGHRAIFDYELEDPRFVETTHVLKGMMASHSASRMKLVEASSPQFVTDAVALAQTYLVLKEEAKHQSLRAFACMRKVICQLDKLTGSRGLCFYLSFEELMDERPHKGTQQRKKAESNQITYQSFMKVAPLPAAINLANLERASYQSEMDQIYGDGVCKGTRVSGNTAVSGRVFYVDPISAEKGLPLDGFEEGDIIVCSMVHPVWLSDVIKSGGVISCVGGWLSHMAIVAREHDVPMVVGVPNALDIAHGEYVEIHPDGSITLQDQVSKSSRTAAE